MYTLDNLQRDCDHFTGKEQINVLCKNAWVWNFSVMTTLVSFWYILHTCTLDVHGLFGGDITAPSRPRIYYAIYRTNVHVVTSIPSVDININKYISEMLRKLLYKLLHECVV